LGQGTTSTIPDYQLTIAANHEWDPENFNVCHLNRRVFQNSYYCGSSYVWKELYLSK